MISGQDSVPKLKKWGLQRFLLSLTPQIVPGPYNTPPEKKNKKQPFLQPTEDDFLSTYPQFTY